MQKKGSQIPAQFQHLEGKIFNVAVRQLRISFLYGLARTEMNRAGTGAPKAARQVPWDACSENPPTALQPSSVDGQGCVYINGPETPGASISSPSRHFNFLVLFLFEEATSSSDFSAQWQLCSACHHHVWLLWIYWIMPICCSSCHFTGGYYCT